MDVVTLALAKKYADSHSGGGVSKVNSVNGKIGNVVLNASDVGAGAVEAVHCDIGSVRVGEIEDATLGKHAHIMGFTSSSKSDPVLRYINYTENGKSSSERLLMTYESSSDDFIVKGDANGKSKTFKLSEYAKKADVNSIYDNGFASRNLFNEKMEIGGIDTTSGASVTYATRMRSVGYTEIDATKSYYICTQSTVSTSATKLRVFYYDSSKAYISYQDWTNTLTIPSGAKYLRFITIDGYGTTYNNDIILNVSDSNNGTYSPYAKSNVELTKLVNDDLKMLGWTVPSECPIQNYTDANGVFHQRVGRVDLGSVTWGYVTTPAPYFGITLSDIKINTNNMYCKSYPITKSNVGIANMLDKTLKSDGGSYAKVYVKDSAYTDATAFKTAMSGVYLYYELATEVTKSVDGNECTSGDVKTLTIPTDNFNIYLVKQGNLKQVRVYEATQKTYLSTNWVDLGTYPEFACADNGISMYVIVPLFDINGKQFASIQFNKSGLIRLRLSATTNGWLQTSATYL